ncbi:VPS10 domain-containing protein [Flavobacterium luminosum]|uniref:Glycosyl hydrolase n=1 Tax=Flavobacterium luminosum TaxID=2949086 RepID=A0ABT0TL48_9FLAO|nr:glycosyl hydrolase [Flavobacterium sp. HXWNR70]MCL9808219.1 glycosyl hydrolase [Flavobacterium sp. HXWNR70]
MKKITLLFLLILQSSIAQNSLFNQVEAKTIGPTIMSGRVVDLAVNPKNPTEFYVAYATGGLWYTNNNGTSFSPVMDAAETVNCGSVTVDWNLGTIWVGTGEVNASRSSYAGVGVLKSSDKGKTWENLGLNDSHHISRIWVNPNNLNEIVVAAVGHLYTTNKERGIYKSTDGGKSWRQTLFVAEDTGIIDLAVSKNNPKIMFAASWQKDRKAWHFDGDGEKSGIYKSEDGGNTWKLVTTKESGFPANEGVGRIGLAMFGENVIYAVLDNQNKRPKTVSKNKLTTMLSTPGADFMEISNKELNRALKESGFRDKYRAENIKNWVADNNMEPKEVLAVLSDANKALFETEVIGCEVYKSEDGGRSWKKTNQNYIDDMFYTYGYYFANISVDEKNQNRVYIGGVPLLFSEDGGKTFTLISKENVHADHHVTWINPENPNHIINGNDGGVNISYDNGEHWIKCNNEAVSQFYAVNVDYQEKYNVYGGMQDNGVWFGPNNYTHSVAWHQEGKYPYQELMGGDGMQTQIDRRNPSVVFTGNQFGNYYKINQKENKVDYITPKAPKGEKPYRFNWQTPILLSLHNQDILYMGSEFLHRSMNQGETWEKISGDLTNGAKEGNVAFGTLTTISESKFQFGLLYTGSDDGKIHVSKDGGASWQLISVNLPQNLWVSRVVASAHKKERVYVTLNGYRSDNFESYVFVSEDFGATWASISNGITQSVNVIVEDSINENILYVGTDNSLFISLDKGTTWQDFSNGIPKVAVHDAVIQSKAKELIVGTHGRSIYKIDISKVQELTKEVLAKNLHLFKVNDRTKSERWGVQNYAWGKPNEPLQNIWFYANLNGVVNISVTNEAGMVVFTREVEAKKGLNAFVFDYSMTKEVAGNWNKKDKNVKIKEAENKKFYLPVGKYKLTIFKDKMSESQYLEILTPKK